MGWLKTEMGTTRPGASPDSSLQASAHGDVLRGARPWCWQSQEGRAGGTNRPCRCITQRCARTHLTLSIWAAKRKRTGSTTSLRGRLSGLVVLESRKSSVVENHSGQRRVRPRGIFARPGASSGWPRRRRSLSTMTIKIVLLGAVLAAFPMRAHGEQLALPEGTQVHVTAPAGAMAPFDTSAPTLILFRVDGLEVPTSDGKRELLEQPMELRITASVTAKDDFRISFAHLHYSRRSADGKRAHGELTATIVESRSPELVRGEPVDWPCPGGGHGAPQRTAEIVQGQRYCGARLASGSSGIFELRKRLLLDDNH